MGELGVGWLARAANWPSRWTAWGLAALMSVMALADGLWLHAATGLARSTHDAMVRWRLWAAPPDPRILIIDIDEASLAAMAKDFGRWPWPRDTLATVMRHVESQGPAAIVWDISFSDPDRLNPGGDAAFSKQAERSPRSHFSVVRLPSANDSASKVGREQLPGLWLPALSAEAQASTATVALIPPAFEALARSQLGLNNAEPDPDGVIRRYEWVSRLSDGSALKTMPLSVAMALAEGTERTRLAQWAVAQPSRLVPWRAHLGAYPRIRFSDVFAQAEASPSPAEERSDFKGKVVLVGSTAPSLHDIHPTPLSPTMPGVESLATVIDNALHQRSQASLPRPLQASLAVALCLAIVFATRRRGATNVGRMTLWLPASLLMLSYASVHTPLFLDLHLALGFGLALLGLLSLADTLRRAHWIARLAPGCLQVSGPCAVVSSRVAWVLDDADLNMVFDALAAKLPSARLVCNQAAPALFGAPAWPHAASCLSLVCPEVSAAQARALLQGLFDPSNTLITFVDSTDSSAVRKLDPAALSSTILRHWADLAEPPRVAPPL